MKLSICMMIKNEEKNLKRCLDSLESLRKSVSSELIIVDTGSTDNSVEIAKQYTDKVYFHEWNDDFSGMRNQTIEYTKGDWVFIIDADEELTDYKPVVEFLNKKINDKVGAIALTVKNETGYAKKQIISKSPRFFRNNKSFHYEGIVHNMPKFIGELHEIKTSLLHYGYINTDTELMDKKFNRTKALLEKALEKDPNYVYYRYQLGVSYMMHKDFYEGCIEFSRAYSLLATDFSKKEFFYVYVQYAKALLVTKKYSKLLDICKEANDIYPEHVDIHYYYAHGFYNLEKYNESMDEFTKYLYYAENYEKLPIYNNMAFAVNTLDNVENANYMLCRICVMLNKTEDIKKYIYKVEDYESTKELSKICINRLIDEGDFNEVLSYYKYVLSTNSVLINGFIMIIENSLSKIDAEERKRFYKEFDCENDKYSKYCRIKSIIVSDQSFSNEFIIGLQDFINAFDINKELIIYSDLIYTALKEQLNIFDITYAMSINKQIEVIDYLRNKFIDLNEVIEDYDFSQNKQIYDIDELIYYKTTFIWKRTQLLDSNDLSEEDYTVKFNDYINAGLNFVKCKYSSRFIENEYLNDVATPEEMFFIYMNQINSLVSENDKIRYFKKALGVYPGMNRGIKICLKNLNISRQNEEFEKYKIQIKQTIRNYIDNGEIENAENLIVEYEAIVKDDLDILLFRSQIAVNKINNEH